MTEYIFIQVYNVKEERYEIHYSPLWQGPTNVLSCDTRLFGEEPTCNYFESIRSMKEINRRITMTEEKDISVKQNKYLSSNIKQICTCEVIEHANGNHYIRVLATDKKWNRDEYETFDNLQVQLTLLLLIFYSYWILMKFVYN